MFRKILLSIFVINSFLYSINIKVLGYGSTTGLIIIEGKSEILVVDNEGNRTGYSDNKFYEEIPGASRVFGTPVDNNRTEIYLSELKEVKVIVKGKVTESYSLLLKLGDYYVKLSDIETKKGQIDEIIPEEDKILINFDSNKKGRYNLYMDNFKYDKFISSSRVSSNCNMQTYIINWKKDDIKKLAGFEYIAEKKNGELCKISGYNLMYISLVFLFAFILFGLAYYKKHHKKIT